MESGLIDSIFQLYLVTNKGIRHLVGWDSLHESLLSEQWPIAEGKSKTKSSPIHLTSHNLTLPWKMAHWLMIYLFETLVFHGYVKLPQCTFFSCWKCRFVCVNSWKLLTFRYSMMALRCLMSTPMCPRRVWPVPQYASLADLPSCAHS